MLGVLASPLYATIYYVDSATGNNVWDGKALLFPWETVSGGNGVNFTQEDLIHIKQTNGSWRVYGAPNHQSQTTAATIITRARYLLNEPAAVFFTDAEMLVWVNEGIEDIAARTNCLETTETDTLVDDQLFYDISMEYLSVSAAVYRLPTVTFNLLQENGDALLQENGDNILIAQSTAAGYKGLDRGSYQNAGHEEGVSEPTHFFEWRDQIGYYPLANSSSAGNTIIAYIIARPYRVPSDANIPLPALYDDALIMYVAAQGFLKDGMVSYSGMLMKEYQQLLDRLRVDYFTRGADSEGITR